MAAKRLVRLPSFAVGHVYFAVTRAATNQQTTPVGRVLNETNISDCTVMHG